MGDTENDFIEETGWSPGYLPFVPQRNRTSIDAENDLLRGIETLIMERRGEESWAYNFDMIFDKDYISDSTFATIKYGLQKGCLNPNRLLLSAAKAVIEYGPDYIQMVGLALRNCADPNLYVNMPVYSTDGVSRNYVSVHILYYLWLLTPQSEEDELYSDSTKILENADIQPSVDTPFGTYPSTVSDDVAAAQDLMKQTMGLLILAGSDPMMPIKDPKLTYQFRRTLSNEVSYMNILTELGSDSRTPVADRILGIGTPLSEDTIAGMQFYENIKDNINRYVSTPAENVVVQSNIAWLLYFTETLDLDNEILILDEGRNENLPRLQSVLAAHANDSAKKVFIASKNGLTDGEKELAFVQAVDAYNICGVEMMLDNDEYVPSHNIIDRIIEASRVKKDEELWLSSAFLNMILVKITERGISIDDLQMKKIFTISEETYNKINSLHGLPRWVHECRSDDGATSTYLMNLARSWNIDPEIGKAGICRVLDTIDKASEEELEDIVGNLQTKRFDLQNKTIRDLIKLEEPTDCVPPDPCPCPAPEPKCARPPMEVEDKFERICYSCNCGNKCPKKQDNCRLPLPNRVFDAPPPEPQVQQTCPKPRPQVQQTCPPCNKPKKVHKVCDLPTLTFKKPCPLPSKCEGDLPLYKQRLQAPDLTKDTLSVGWKPPTGMMDELSCACQSRCTSCSKCSKPPLAERKSDRPLVGGQYKVCRNEGMMARDPKEYSDMDLTLIEDDGDVYCVESVDYPTILQTGVNSFTGNKITTKSMNEIKSKYGTISNLGLPLGSMSPQDAIREIKGLTNSGNPYEREIDQAERQFLALMYQNGIPRDYFTNSEGLSREAMANLVISITGNEDFYAPEDRRSLIRSVAMEIMQSASSDPSIVGNFTDGIRSLVL